MFLKAPVKDSALEDLIWFHSYKSRAAHQLKSISSTKRKEEHPSLTQTFISRIQADRATGASAESVPQALLLTHPVTPGTREGMTKGLIRKKMVFAVLVTLVSRELLPGSDVDKNVNV